MKAFLFFTSFSLSLAAPQCLIDLDAQKTILATACSPANITNLAALESPDQKGLEQTISAIGLDAPTFCLNAGCRSALDSYRSTLAGSSCKSFTLTSYGLQGADIAFLVDLTRRVLCATSVNGSPCTAIEKNQSFPFISPFSSIFQASANKSGGNIAAGVMDLLNNRPLLCSKCGRDQFGWFSGAINLPAYIKSIAGSLVDWVSEEVNECPVITVTSISTVSVAKTVTSIPYTQEVFATATLTSTVNELYFSTSCPLKNLLKRDSPASPSMYIPTTTTTQYAVITDDITTTVGKALTVIYTPCAATVTETR